MRRYPCPTRRSSGVPGHSLLLALGLFAALVAIPPRSASAGGLGLYEVGSPDTGLAAAGYAARAQDASTLFTNPAGMTRLTDSQLLLGIQPMHLDLSFDQDGDTTVSGGDGGNAIGWIPAGSAFLVYSISPDVKVGIGMFSNFGLGVDYGTKWAGRYQVADVSLIGLSFMPAAAYRISDQFSVGAGLNAMYGSMSSKVVVNNAIDQIDDGRLKIEDTTWGFGGEFGILFEPGPGTRFGLTYLTEVSLDFEDSPDLWDLGPGLAAILDRSDLRSVDMDVNVPQSLMASVYHELSDSVALLGNVGWQDWSRFGRFGVEVRSANPKDLTVDMDYRDTWHVAVGAQYRPAPGWLLSGGVAYDSSMVKDSDRTVGVPVGETYRFGVGAQYDISEATTLGFAYELLYGPSMSVDQERGPLGGRVSGEYDPFLGHVFTLSFIYRF